MTQNANEAKNSRSFAEQSVFASSIPSSMIETFVLLKQNFGSLSLVNMAKSRKIFRNFKKVQDKSHNFHVILKSR